MYCYPYEEENEDFPEDDFDSFALSESTTDFPSQQCCCRCCTQQKPIKKKGKFGLAYVMQSPKLPDCPPCGWQLEFNDTPSQVERNCKHMLKWVNTPPLMNSIKRSNRCPAGMGSRNRSPMRNTSPRCCSPSPPRSPRRSSPVRRMSPVRQCSPKRFTSPQRRANRCVSSNNHQTSQKPQVIVCCIPDQAISQNVDKSQQVVYCSCKPIQPVSAKPIQNCCCSQNINNDSCKMCCKPIEVNETVNNNCCCSARQTNNQTVCNCSNPLEAEPMTRNCCCLSNAQDDQFNAGCRCINTPQNIDYSRNQPNVTCNCATKKQQLQRSLPNSCPCCQPKNQNSFFRNVNNSRICQNPCCPKIYEEDEEQCMCLSKGDKLCCDCLGHVFEKLHGKYCVCRACGNVYPKNECCQRCNSESEYDYIPKRDQDCRCSNRNARRRSKEQSRSFDNAQRLKSQSMRYDTRKMSSQMSKQLERELDEVPTISDRLYRSSIGNQQKSQITQANRSFNRSTGKYEEPVKEVGEKSRISKITVGTGSKNDRIEGDPTLPQGSVLIQVFSDAIAEEKQNNEEGSKRSTDEDVEQKKQ